MRTTRSASGRSRRGYWDCLCERNTLSTCPERQGARRAMTGRWSGLGRHRKPEWRAQAVEGVHRGDRDRQIDEILRFEG